MRLVGVFDLSSRTRFERGKGESNRSEANWSGVGAMPVPADSRQFRRWQEAGTDGIPAANVRIITSGGRSIPAHSRVLASASPVLERMMEKPTMKRGKFGDKKIITILGVPCDAVEVFVRFLYSAWWSSEEEEEMGRYGMHLLALSHVFRVGRLKQACEEALSARLTAEVVVDVLQLARLCDAPRLYIRCMGLVANDFSAVEQTEAWGFVRAHDPWLELEILQFIHDADLRQKRRRRKREEQEVYLQLSEAMECLQHIYTEGCTDVGPRDKEPPNKGRPPCATFRTCRSLQLLICHLAACDRKRSCPRCRRMWRLLRLHSSICCDQPDRCKVPLCRQFKLRDQQMEGKGGDDDNRWRLLAKKVASVRVMSSLARRKGLQETSPRSVVGYIYTPSN